MALDKKFILTNQLPILLNDEEIRLIKRWACELAGRTAIVDRSSCRPCSNEEQELLNGFFGRLGGDDAGLYVPPMNAQDVEALLVGFWTLRGNLYDHLHKYGALSINPTYRTPDGRVVLSGGSYSTVTLRVDCGAAVVSKKIRKVGGNNAIDTHERLRLESKYLQKLPAEASAFFPCLKSARESATEVEYEMEFVSLPTVGELIFQKCLDGHQVFELLVRIYSSMMCSMYPHAPLQLNSRGCEEGYLERIERRMGIILNHKDAPTERLRKLFTAQQITVNGVKCPSILALIKKLRGTQGFERVVNPIQRSLCHGDLVLEDILANPRCNERFCLLDPNPMSWSPLFDIGKTMLSLWVGYEFLYYDLFCIEQFLEKRGGEIEVRIALGRPDSQDRYQDATELFLEFAEKELANTVGLEASNLRAQLRMAAALHALAIPMFHLLHHRNEPRAVAFGCLGLYHASKAWSILCEG